MILDDIIFNKRQEVTALKVKFSGKDPQKLVKGLPKPRNFLKAFKKGKLSLIAEIKKASPSAGVIRQDFYPISLAKTYEESGAVAVSVLTDAKFFLGKLEYLKAAKESTTIPILRKDFVIDESQIYETRIAGADALLLIVRVLSDDELISLLALTEKLGMQALVEAHNAEEVERVLKTDAKIVGINNRDLDTFKVDLQTTVKLLKKFPKLKKRMVISESGVESKADIDVLKKAGVDGVLIGETLMRSNNIPAKIMELFGK
ncbi:MAG: indole-3-glycerol phosphate synthase TrpC [Candidatus Margulisiibacteriota bacterium]